MAPLPGHAAGCGLTLRVGGSIVVIAAEAALVAREREEGRVGPVADEGDRLDAGGGKAGGQQGQGLRRVRESRN